MSHHACPTPRELSQAALRREEEAAAGHTRFPGSGVNIPLTAEAQGNGIVNLVNADTGEIVSPCASQEIADRTIAFFS